VTVWPWKLGKFFGTGIDFRAATIALSGMSPYPGVPAAFVAGRAPALPTPPTSQTTARASMAAASAVVRVFP